MDASHVLVVAPLVVFALFFLLILILRSFVLIGRADPSRRAIECRSTITTSSVETVIDVSVSSTNCPVQNPPGYYSDVMSTDSSALYPVYVPPYSSPLMSLRDPRHFQGLPGLQAPPPYPPPPTYSQIHNFPELPTGSHTILDGQQPRTSKRVDNVTPVE